MDEIADLMIAAIGSKMEVWGLWLKLSLNSALYNPWTYTLASKRLFWENEIVNLMPVPVVEALQTKVSWIWVKVSGNSTLSSPSAWNLASKGLVRWFLTWFQLWQGHWQRSGATQWRYQETQLSPIHKPEFYRVSDL